MGPLEGDEVMRVESHDGNSAFIKGAPESSLTPSGMCGFSENPAVCEPGSGPSRDTESYTSQPREL